MVPVRCSTLFTLFLCTELFAWQFTNYTIANGLTDNMARAIVTDTSGTVWFGTLGGGLPSGSYIVRVQTDKEVVTAKIHLGL